LVDATISGCALGGEGLIILGIEREKEWISVPEQGKQIRKGDRLVVYGPLEELKSNFT
jgi:uncharacterized protein with PhoU and TrkA domain